MVSPPRYKILVIDDDPAIRTSLPRLLSILGADATAVEDLAGAAAELRAGSWDAILLDLKLASGNSLDLLPSAFAKLTVPPVILMSGLASSEDVGRAFRLPVADFIGKPFGLADLARALDRAWARPALKPHLAAPNLLFLQHVFGMIGHFDRNGPVDFDQVMLPVLESARFHGACVAWCTASQQSLSSIGREAVGGPGALNPAFATTMVGAAMVGTGWNVEGPWRAVAERWALKTARSLRSPQSPSTSGGSGFAQLRQVIEAVGPLTLMVAAPSLSGYSTPSADLIKRLEEHGTIAGMQLFSRWGLTESLLARIGLPRDACSGDSVPGAGSLAWVGEAAARSAEPPAGPPGFNPSPLGPADALELARELERVGRGPVALDSWTGWSRLVNGAFALPVILRTLSPREIDVHFVDEDYEILQQLAQDTRVQGTWLEVGRDTGSRSARVPVEVARISDGSLTDPPGPTVAHLRIVGAPHHEDELRKLVFSGMNRRRSVRVTADPKLPMRVVLSGRVGEPSYEAVIRDMSLDGLGLVMTGGEAPCPATGTVFDIEIGLHDGGSPITAQGRLARTRRASVPRGAPGGVSVLVEWGIELEDGSMGHKGTHRWVATVMMRQREVMRAEQDIRA